MPPTVPTRRAEESTGEEANGHVISVSYKRLLLWTLLHSTDDKMGLHASFIFLYLLNFIVYKISSKFCLSITKAVNDIKVPF